MKSIKEKIIIFFIYVFEYIYSLYFFITLPLNKEFKKMIKSINKNPFEKENNIVKNAITFLFFIISILLLWNFILFKLRCV